MPDKPVKVTRAMNNRINKLAQNVQTTVDDLYKNTYYSPNDLGKDLQSLSKQINDNLDKIADKNLQTVGVSNISKLFSRISPKDLGVSDNKEVVDGIQKMFEDPIAMDDLYTSFMNTKYLKDLDYEIDTILKYMPSLAEALAVKKDNVLSADYFSKDFLTIRSSEAGDDTTFTERCDNLKKNYDLLRLVEDVYDKAAKYGESFVYIVPYKTAIAKLLQTKDQTVSHGYNRDLSSFSPNMRESYIRDESRTRFFNLKMDKTGLTITDSSTKNNVVKESAVMVDGPNPKNRIRVPKVNLFNENEQFNLEIELCGTGVIESLVKEAKHSYEERERLNESFSLNQQFKTTLREANEKKSPFIASQNIPNNNRTLNTAANDGLVNINGTFASDKEKKINITVPGCIVKKLPRDQVIPIYIDDMCMGYYYIEFRPSDFDDQMNGFDSTLGNPLASNLRNGFRTFNNVTDPFRQDEMIKYISGELSKFIDKNFVNNNQDLRRELYMILKYNDIYNHLSIDRLKVTYVPPEDIFHVFFRQDEETKRGISDLDKALIPATMWISLALTDAIGTITRGSDKRVYYVKQNVEQNIAKTLLTTIAQIKQGNFGYRQFQNINNILNISGRFNDYVIPTNASGDQPIQFEILQGQQFETKTDLMEKLEEMAINSVDVPKEIVQTRQSIDYAIQLSMSSSKFLRYLYNRQSLFETKVLTPMISRIFNCEYDENITLDVTLPPPSFLNITNTTQLITNTASFVDEIINTDLPDAEDQVKAEVKKQMFRYYIGSHLNTAKHEEIYNKAMMIVEQKKKQSENDNG